MGLILLPKEETLTQKCKPRLTPASPAKKKAAPQRLSSHSIRQSWLQQNRNVWDSGVNFQGTKWKDRPKRKNTENAHRWIWLTSLLNSRFGRQLWEEAQTGAIPGTQIQNQESKLRLSTHMHRLSFKAVAIKPFHLCASACKTELNRKGCCS